MGDELVPPPPPPLRVYWELTRACDLACRHCRARAQPEPGADELDTAACERVLVDLATQRAPAPHVVFTGGDPLKRADLPHLVHFARACGLGASVAPSATASVTAPAVRALKDAGALAMSLSLDAASPRRHDQLRGVPGCHAATLRAADAIVQAGIPLQINTLVCEDTHQELEALVAVVAGLGASRWSIFLLVPVGRGRALTQISPAAAEATLVWLAERRDHVPMVVTTTEAPQFRRVVIERLRAAGQGGGAIRRDPIARSFGVRDGNGIVFVAANGDITPSGFLPLVAGNARRDSVLAVYRRHPLFEALRRPDEFHGRCGACQYRHICGGSRARAWAARGDPLGEDPLCALTVPAPA